MDELNITSKFMCKILSKIVESIIRKNGYDMNIQFDKINATVGDKVCMHIDVNVEMSRDELLKIIAKKN